MNLRDLKYLIAVADERHFGRAAALCHVSQPTLSGQVKKLEDYLGVAIFERTSKSVATTPAGEEIIRRARLAVEQAEAILALAQVHRAPMAGPLRLGVIPTLGPYLVPLVLRSLRERFPALRVVLVEDLTHSLLFRLHEHAIDCALLATTVTDPDVESLPLFEEPFWVAYPSGHPFSELEEITEQDLVHSNLLLLADGHCLADQVRSVCRAAGEARPDTSDVRAASLETLLQLIATGFGTTLVPALALRGLWASDLGVVTRPAKMPLARRTVSLAYRRSFPRVPTLEALADLMVEHLPDTVTVLRRADAARKPGRHERMGN